MTLTMTSSIDLNTKNRTFDQSAAKSRFEPEVTELLQSGERPLCKSRLAKSPGTFVGSLKLCQLFYAHLIQNRYKFLKIKTLSQSTLK